MPDNTTSKQRIQVEKGFIEEARIHEACNKSEFVADFISLCIIDNKKSMQLKFYSDGSLKNMLDDFGNKSKHTNITNKIFTDSLMIEFLKKIAEGMKYIQDKNFIHLDLAPRNILLELESNTVNPKITDFGLAMDLSKSNVVQGKLPMHQYPCYFWLNNSKFDKKKIDVFSFGLMALDLFMSIKLRKGSEYHNFLNLTEKRQFNLSHYCYLNSIGKLPYYRFFKNRRDDMSIFRRCLFDSIQKTDNVPNFDELTKIGSKDTPELSETFGVVFNKLNNVGIPPDLKHWLYTTDDVDLKKLDSNKIDGVLTNTYQKILENLNINSLNLQEIIKHLTSLKGQKNKSQRYYTKIQKLLESLNKIDKQSNPFLYTFKDNKVDKNDTFMLFLLTTYYQGRKSGSNGKSDNDYIFDNFKNLITDQLINELNKYLAYYLY